MGQTDSGTGGMRLRAGDIREVFVPCAKFCYEPFKTVLKKSLLIKRKREKGG